jgi:hypothetical protein
VKHEFRYHLLGTVVLFVIISIFLVIFRVGNLQLLSLALCLFLGSFFLDIDHLIFWFFLKPNLEESRLARLALKNKDFKSVYRLLKASHRTHQNLIFHHYFFQVILAIFTIFILTSTTNFLVASFLIALNLHLIIDEVIDYLYDPKILQKWLFAREENQLPIKYLNRYIFVFIFVFILFLVLLIRSQI